ncbi:MAG TPA: hypothetical protein VKD90_18350, partial [Gemmataceae bacterium]|nr:hypothetical protein [Gemmataceae bacterium]
AANAATTWLANEFRFSNPPHTFYTFDVIAALGRASERKDLGTKDKKREWYRGGCELLTGMTDSPGLAQKPGGEWQIKQAIDDFPVVSTSFALRFLASRPD